MGLITPKCFRVVLRINQVLKRLVSTVRFCPSTPFVANGEIVLSRKEAVKWHLSAQPRNIWCRMSVSLGQVARWSRPPSDLFDYSDLID